MVAVFTSRRDQAGGGFVQPYQVIITSHLSYISAYTPEN